MSRWFESNVYINHDGGDEAMQFMEDLSDLIASIVIEVTEDTPYAAHINGCLACDAPEGYEDEIDD